jgi:hypothetical protein
MWTGASSAVVETLRARKQQVSGFMLKHRRQLSAQESL